MVKGTSSSLLVGRRDICNAGADRRMHTWYLSNLVYQRVGRITVVEELRFPMTRSVSSEHRPVLYYSSTRSAIVDHGQYQLDPQYVDQDVGPEAISR
jgi:hypothetical protein